MASTTQNAPATTQDTAITIKITYNGSVRKFKLPLRELNVNDFSESKVRTLLGVPEGQKISLERFSDSSGAYLSLDPSNPAAYKQLYRAAKAKLKLRIKASIIDDQPPAPALIETEKKDEPIFQEKSDLPEIKKPSPLDNDAAMRKLSVPPAANAYSQWQIFCNSCDKIVGNGHYHCNVCDGGDYDLCEDCVAAGIFCHGDEHVLIKRTIVNGKMVTSQTHKLPPKAKATPEKEMPGTFKTTRKEAPMVEPTRTCNTCVRVLPEKLLVTCNDCEDYDLCVSCHSDNKHGHHPAHSFSPTNKDATLSAQTLALCAPGRDVRHHAICDGCDQTIYGVRHKCLVCPDWDFCNDCSKTAKTSHPGHRFAPLYDALNYPASASGIHFGIFCDGPLCKGNTQQSYIRGIRYKCAICHDTDFCANCEAHPSNKHNVTHPLIKFKTQVRNVTVTTQGEDGYGESLGHMGDLNPRGNAVNRRTLTLPPPYSQAAPASPEASVAPAAPIDSAVLDGVFICDSVVDGTRFPSNWPFVQTWTIRNPGPHSWPKGCSVRQVGGDNMLNVDHEHPATVSALSRAKASNPTLDVIAPGQEHSFEVHMRAPYYPGKYISYWRVKAPDGTAFGHKLWCDIEVTTNSTAALSSPPSSSSSKPPTGTPSQPEKLCDYQMQLMLLEQANKRRLMMARRENPSSPTTSAPSQNDAEMSARTMMQLHNQKAETMKAMSMASARAQQVNQAAAAAAARMAHRDTLERRDSTPVVPEMLVETTSKAVKVEEEPETSQSPGANIDKAEPEKPEASTMVFPKLEKESPSSSTVDITTPAAPAEERLLSSAATETETATTHEEKFEDAEELDLAESDDDDEFLTDEEYDILDASDEEIINGGRPSA